MRYIACMRATKALSFTLPPEMLARAKQLAKANRKNTCTNSTGHASHGFKT